MCKYEGKMDNDDNERKHNEVKKNKKRRVGIKGTDIKIILLSEEDQI